MIEINTFISICGAFYCSYQAFKIIIDKIKKMQNKKEIVSQEITPSKWIRKNHNKYIFITRTLPSKYQDWYKQIPKESDDINGIYQIMEDYYHNLVEIIYNTCIEYNVPLEISTEAFRHLWFIYHKCEKEEITFQQTLFKIKNRLQRE